MVSAHADRVVAGSLPRAELHRVADEPDGRLHGKDPRPATDVLLEDIVLGRAGDPLAGHPLLLGHGEVHGQDDGRDGIHRQGHADLVDGDALEGHLHVLEGVHGHADPTDLPEGHRIVGVQAHLGGQVEGHVQGVLAVFDQEAEPPVGLGGATEAGVLAHGPGPVAVHVLVNSSGEGILPRLPDVLLDVDVRDVCRPVDGLHLDAGFQHHVP